MADRDQGRIEVQLSLLSGRDTAAAEALAKSIGQIAESFKALQATDYKDTAEKLAKLHAKMANDTERLIQEGKAMQQRGQGEGGRSFIERTRERLAGVISPNTTEGATERAEKAKEEAAQAHKEQQKREQDRADQQRQSQANLTEEQRTANIRRAKIGIPPLGSTQGDKEGAWYNAPGGPLAGNEIDPLTGEASGTFRIPRFGQLNPQDYLNMLRDRTVTKMQTTRNDTDMTNEQREAEITRLGGKYETLSKFSRYAGGGYAALAAGRFFNRYLQFAPTALADEGAQLGYTRDTGSIYPSHILGMQTPFSAAGAEGWRQQRDTLNMRMLPGINAEQARSITSATASAGFGGNIGSELRRNFFAPAMQRWGVDSNAIAPFTQMLRTGTGNLDDLNRAISDLGDVARAANMDVSQTAQAMDEVAKATQQMGGSYRQGLDYAKTFQSGTGLPATVGAQLSQNPIVQGYVAAQTGMPAFAQGALPASTRNRATRQALAQMVSAYEGSMPGYTDTVRNAQGEIVARPHMSGHQAAIAGAAQALGIDYDQARKMLGTGDRQNTVDTAMAMIDDYTQRTGRLERGGGSRLRADRRQGILDRIGNFQHKEVRFNNKGEVVDNDGNVILKREDVINQGKSWALDKTSGTIKDGTGWSELVATAKKMGVDPDKLASAGKKGDYRDRANTVRHLIQNQVADNKAKYTIGFTGEAERFFKVMAKKTNTDYPDGPRNSNAAKAKGPGGLGDDLKAAAASLFGNSTSDAVDAFGHVAGDALPWNW